MILSETISGETRTEKKRIFSSFDLIQRKLTENFFSLFFTSSDCFERNLLEIFQHKFSSTQKVTAFSLTNLTTMNT